MNYQANHIVSYVQNNCTISLQKLRKHSTPLRRGEGIIRSNRKLGRDKQGLGVVQLSAVECRSWWKTGRIATKLVLLSGKKMLSKKPGVRLMGEAGTIKDSQTRIEHLLTVSYCTFWPFLLQNLCLSPLRFQPRCIEDGQPIGRRIVEQVNSAHLRRTSLQREFSRSNSKSKHLKP